LAATKDEPSRQAILIAAITAVTAIIGEAGRAVKPAIVAFFSTLVRRSPLARITRTNEHIPFAAGPWIAASQASLRRII
jgi:hypothetical protein